MSGSEGAATAPGEPSTGVSRLEARRTRSPEGGGRSSTPVFLDGVFLENFATKIGKNFPISHVIERDVFKYKCYY